MDNEGHESRWRAVAPLRLMLVRVGLAQGVSREDAEDAAQEALLRAVTADNLDMTRVEAWLTRVTQRLCVDRHRQRARDERLQRRMAAADALCPSAEDAICDQALGAWALRHADLLAPRERDVLFARAEGHDAAATARILGLTYKSAESAYTRARAKMRATVRSALGALGLLRLVRHRRVGPAIAAAAPVGVLLAVQAQLGLLAPGDADSPAEHQRPIRPVSSAGPAELTGPSVRTSSDRALASSTAPQPGDRPPAARAARSAPSRQDVIKTEPVRVGPVHHDGAGASWRHQDETLEETLQRCVAKGVEITPQRIGCRE